MNIFRFNPLSAFFNGTVLTLSLVGGYAHAADYCEPESSESLSPYDNTSGSTRSVLGIAKHQYQGDGGKYDCISYSEMLDGDYANNTVGGSNYFYFAEESGVGDSLYFKVDESVTSRTELRLESFQADTVSPAPEFGGTFKIRGSSADRSTEFTVAQLHIDQNTTTDSDAITSSPMLRIAYYESRSGLDDHLWAVFRTDPDFNGSGGYEYQDLGEALFGSSNENSFLMTYGTDGGDTITVTGNGEEVDFDISKWTQSDIDIYNKAGCYTDGDVGDCQIQYTSLEHDNY
ncbi:polysaccharide lyase family 7 protein [Alteromonas sp. 5E99-2]|uniref:polysaccharide lyase family 7 protein n=1 Tax=Alteromonas sp. 5E99-2 TaxID=2817683 RepID=UPI001A98C42B|nr:polysaccharide lyase family 7 protein [Alteromonas sp. 5E99-2]MBO1254464.1 polysaccharide lyase family 7 protein [Alteromonas sp. 5E99-2]